MRQRQHNPDCDLCVLESREQQGQGFSYSQKIQAATQYLIEKKFGSITEFVDKTGISRPTTSATLLKGKVPSTKVTFMLAKACGVSVKEFETASATQLRLAIDSSPAADYAPVKHKPKTSETASALSYLHWLSSLSAEIEGLNKYGRGDSAKIANQSFPISAMYLPPTLEDTIKRSAMVEESGLRISPCAFFSLREGDPSMQHGGQSAKPMPKHMAITVIVLGEEDQELRPGIVYSTLLARNQLEARYSGTGYKVAIICVDESGFGFESKMLSALQPTLVDLIVYIKPDELHPDIPEYSEKLLKKIADGLL